MCVCVRLFTVVVSLSTSWGLDKRWHANLWVTILEILGAMLAMLASRSASACVALVAEIGPIPNPLRWAAAAFFGRFCCCCRRFDDRFRLLDKGDTHHLSTSRRPVETAHFRPVVSANQPTFRLPLPGPVRVAEPLHQRRRRRPLSRGSDDGFIGANRR